MYTDVYIYGAVCGCIPVPPSGTFCIETCAFPCIFHVIISRRSKPVPKIPTTPRERVPVDRRMQKGPLLPPEKENLSNSRPYSRLSCIYSNNTVSI